MKFITTLYHSREVEFRLTIQPKNRKDANGNWSENETMLQHYVSKSRSESLIFNPSVYISITSMSNVRVSATVPMHLAYRFTSLLTQVYNNSMSKDVYREDNGLFLDQKGAIAAARRMSLYRYSLTVFPEIMPGADNSQVKGIAFQVDKERIGAIPLNEISTLIDILDHMDMATYTLVVGLLEEIQGLQLTNDIILQKLTTIEGILSGAQPTQTRNNPQPRQSSAAGIFDWTPLGFNA